MNWRCKNYRADDINCINCPVDVDPDCDRFVCLEELEPAYGAPEPEPAPEPQPAVNQPPVLTSGERLVWAAEFSASARWNRSLDPLLRQRCAMEDALEAVLFMRRTASNNPPGDSQATMMLHEMLES